MNAEILEKSDEAFYSDGANYWSEIPATVDGMLGGFGFISQTDIKGSKILLKHLFNSKNPPGRNYALDCGAGIGRVTKFLLTDMFDKVDLVEQNSTFLQQAKKYLGPKMSKIGDFYSVGLQNFHPQSGKYDVIWVQWVLGHLTDGDLINFLVCCRKGLRPNGVIVVKENITSSNDVEMDRQDSSVTRPLRLLRQIFDKAAFECYRQTKQQNFPKALYMVYMFVLKPKPADDCHKTDLNSDENVTDIHSKSEHNVVINESQMGNIQSFQENVSNKNSTQV